MAKKKRKTTGKTALTLSLSSQARERLAEMSQKAGYSRSAFVESVMSGKVAIATVEPEKSLAFTIEDETANPQKMTIAVVENGAQAMQAEAPNPDNSHLEEIKKLRAKIEEQAKQIATLSTEKSNSPSTLKVAPSRNENASKPVAKESLELAAKEKEIANLNQQLKTTQAEILTLKNEWDESKDRSSTKADISPDVLKELQSAKSNLERRVLDLQRQIEAKDAVIAELRSTVKETETNAVRLNEMIAAKDKNLAALRQEFEQKDTQVRANQTKNQTLEKQLEEQYARVSSLAKEIAQQKNEVQQLEQVKAQLAEVKAHGDRLQRQLREAQGQHQQAMAQSTTVASQKQQLEAQLNNSEKAKTLLTTQLQNSTQQQVALEQKIAELTKINAQLTVSQDLVRQLQTQIEAFAPFEAQCEALQRRYDAQTARLKELEVQAALDRSVANIGEKYLNRWQRR
ncbi:hypothetical protein [[Limnothrix rosea] IAM M-220]|uniref:hypothetical protein n=1 Tax=[Limnothrix rosea] IAM M-220 TaxID=454133 RepID=UPI00095E7CB4|nr:hypothetical protein [[Limnothrix rosea] IAM M-220]OKH13809.1 hypothetical protein NIES208_14595 [[Limnothrix rosea] IAM M-220]